MAAYGGLRWRLWGLAKGTRARHWAWGDRVGHMADWAWGDRVGHMASSTSGFRAGDTDIALNPTTYSQFSHGPLS